MDENEIMFLWFGWFGGMVFVFLLLSFRYWLDKRVIPRPPMPEPVEESIPPAQVSQVSEIQKSKNNLFGKVGGLFAKPPPQYFDKDGKQINVTYTPINIPPPPVPESVLAPEHIPINPPVVNTVKFQGYCHKCKQKMPLHDVEFKDYTTTTGVHRFAVGYCDKCLTKSSNMVKRGVGG